MPEAATYELSAEDRADVIEACRRMAWYIDDRDWSALGELFDETLTVDYSSVFGGKPTVTPGRDFAAYLGSVLSRLAGTQHLVTNHRVTATADGATCISQVQATHVVSSREGGPMWTGSGDYRIDLVHRDGRWRISSYAFHSTWNTGNRGVMTEAFRGSRTEPAAAEPIASSGEPRD